MINPVATRKFKRGGMIHKHLTKVASLPSHWIYFINPEYDIHRELL